MGDTQETLIRRHIDWSYADEASRARVHTEAHILRELERLGQRDLRDPNVLRGTIARAVRAEGIRIITRRLQICLKTFSDAGETLTSSRMAFLEDTVRDALEHWISERRPYLGAKLRSVSSDPAERLVEEVFWEVRRAVEREIEIVKARHLLYSESPEDGVSVEQLARARVLPCAATDLAGGREVARRLAAVADVLGDSYLQIAADLSRPDRFTYAGPIAELTAVIAAAIGALAPDRRVRAWLDEIPEPCDNDERPSRVQKIRFIIYEHTPTGNGNRIARGLENLLDNTLPGFIGGYHETNHLAASRTLAREEAMRLFRYADSLLRELLPSDGAHWSGDRDLSDDTFFVPGETVASTIEPVRRSD